MAPTCQHGLRVLTSEKTTPAGFPFFAPRIVRMCARRRPNCDRRQDWRNRSCQPAAAAVWPCRAVRRPPKD
eukprot:5996162-Pyramimonas_sp.AAC.1